MDEWRAEGTKRDGSAPSMEARQRREGAGRRRHRGARIGLGLALVGSLVAADASVLDAVGPTLDERFAAALTDAGLPTLAELRSMSELPEVEGVFVEAERSLADARRALDALPEVGFTATRPAAPEQPSWARDAFLTELAGTEVVDAIEVFSSDVPASSGVFSTQAFTTQDSLEPLTWVDLEPIDRFDGPITFDEPLPIVTGRSFRMLDTETMTATGNALEIFDLEVADLTGNGLDDVVALATGRRDSALFGGPDQPPFKIDGDDTERDLYVIVARADGAGGFEPGRAYRMRYTWFSSYTRLRGGLALGDVNGNGHVDIVLTTGYHTFGASGEVEGDRRILTLLNDGDGLFPNRVGTQVERILNRDAHLMDVDGDGVLDLVAGSDIDNATNGQAVEIHRGVGDGTFTRLAVLPVEHLVSTIPIRLADDLAGIVTVADAVYSNLPGAWLWTPDDETHTAWSPSEIVAPRFDDPDGPQRRVQAHGAFVGDLTGDGRDDLVLVARGPNGAARTACELASSFQQNDRCARVFVNETTEAGAALVARPEIYPLRFEQQTYYDQGNRLSGRMADVDGDGRPDLVVPGRFGDVWVLHGDGAGAFDGADAWNGLPNLTPVGGWGTDTEYNGYYLAAVGARPVRVDADPSAPRGLVVASRRTYEPNTSRGEFHSSISLVEPAGGRRFRSAPVASMLRSGNSQGFARSNVLSPHTQHLVDWTGDGRDDLVAVVAYSEFDTGESLNALVLFPASGGGFGAPEWIGAVPADCLMTSRANLWSIIDDFDGDGKLDLACGASRLSVMLQADDGGLETPIELGTVFVDAPNSTEVNLATIRGLAFADLDGDGRRDLVVAGQHATGNRAFVAWARQVPADGPDETWVDERLAFEPLVEIYDDGLQSRVDHEARDIAIADLTGDGAVDVAFTRGPGVGDDGPRDRFVLLRNTSTPGSPSFAAERSPGFLGGHYHHVNAVDLGGPGTDLVVTARVFDNNFAEFRWISAVLHNDGNGSFTIEALPGFSSRPVPLAVDLDGDGRPDLVTPTNWRGIEVRRQGEDGTFELPVAHPVATPMTAWVGATDLDGDDQLDLVALHGYRWASTVHPHPDLTYLRNTSDGQVPEVAFADLAIDDVRVFVDGQQVDGVDPVAFPASTDVEVRVRVRNDGDRTSSSGATLTVWLSIDDELDAADVRLADLPALPPIPVGSSLERSVTVPLVPRRGGEQFVIARVDAQRRLADADRSNDIGSTTVDVGVVDLQVSRLDPPFTAEPVTVTPTVGRPAVVRIRSAAVEGGSSGEVRILVDAPDAVVSTVRAGVVPQGGAGVSVVGTGELTAGATTDDRYLLVAGSGPVTLRAQAVGTVLQTVSPRSVYEGQPLTLRLGGPGVDDLLADPELVVSMENTTTSQEVVADRILPDGSGGLFASFERTFLGGFSSSTIDVVARPSSGSEHRLERAVRYEATPRIVIGNEPVFWWRMLSESPLRVRVQLPEVTRPDRVYNAFVVVENRGVRDTVMPFVGLRANPARQAPDSPYEFSLDSPFFVRFEDTVGPVGVLPPGATTVARVPFVSDDAYGFTFEVIQGTGTGARLDRLVREALPVGFPEARRSEVEDRVQVLMDGAAFGVNERSASAFVQALHAFRADVRPDLDDPRVLRRALVEREALGVIGDAPLHGRILRDGAPAADVTVVAHRDDGAEFATTTMLDGSFHLWGLDPAPGVTWTLSLAGHGPGGLGAFTTADGPVDVGELTVPDGAEVSGAVTGPTGGLVTDALVRISTPPSGAEPDVVETTVDDDGRYRFPAIVPGVHDLAVAGPNGVFGPPVELIVATEPVTRDLQVSATGVVSGALLDVDGTPFAGAPVVLASAGQRVETVTSADGAFTFTGVAGGEVDVTATAPDRVGATASVTVPAGSTVDVGDLTLSTATVVQGTVTRGGVPAAGVQVGSSTGLVDAVETRVDGTYELVVPLGDVEVTFAAPGAASVLRAVTTAADEPTTLDVALVDAVTLEVEVRSADDAPVGPGVPVEVVGGGEAPRVGTTDASGTVRFSDLAVGTWTLVSGQTSRPVTVAGAAGSEQDEILVLGGAHRVVGRVVDSAEAPVVGAIVGVLTTIGGTVTQVSQIATGADGGFEVAALPGRAIELLFTAPEIGLRRIAVPAEPTGTNTSLGDVGPSGSVLELSVPWNVGAGAATSFVTVQPVGIAGVPGLLVGMDPSDPTSVSVGPLPDGSYRVSVSVPADGDEFDTVTEIIEVPVAEPVEIERPETGAISGIADGGSAVSLRHLVTDEVVYRQAEDETGAWDASGLRVGSWQLLRIVDRTLRVETVTITAGGFATVSFAPSGTPTGVATSFSRAVTTFVVPRDSHDIFAGPSDRGCTSDGTAPLTAVARITSSFVEGEVDSYPTAVKLLLDGQVVEALTPGSDGWVRTSFLPDGNYQIEVTAKHHEPNVVSFTIPQDVTSNGFRCGATLGDVPRGTPVTYAEADEPGFGQQLVQAIRDLFGEGPDDNRPSSTSHLEQIRSHQRQTDEQIRPVPPPPPCPGDPPRRPRTPQERGEDLADHYLREAKKWAGIALDTAAEWDAQFTRLRVQYGLLVAELVTRAVGFAADVALELIGPIAKLAKEVTQLEDVVKAAKLQQQIEAMEAVGTAIGLVKDFVSKMGEAALAALASQSLAPISTTLGDINLALKQFLAMVTTIVKEVGPGLAKAFAEFMPVVGLVISALENISGAANSMIETARAIESMEGELANYEQLYQGADDRAMQNWNAYLSLLTGESLMKAKLPVPPGYPGPGTSDCEDPLRPRDPNDIRGPVGVGDERWLAPASTLDYVVRFENLGPGSTEIPDGAAPAEAPATVVDVRVPLDPNVDLASFELGTLGFGVEAGLAPFGFGEVRFEPEPGAQRFEETRVMPARDLIDFDSFDGGTESVALELRASAWVDPVEREARWMIELLDPRTGLPHLDPSAGFLPPEPDDDALTGAGQGFVTYRVGAEPDLDTGTTITAQATIVFDTESSLDTNVWSNRVDATTPTSSVSVPATVPANGSISWSGTDVGAGVDRFEVWRVVDDGDLELWVTSTPETSVALDGEAGQTIGVAVRAVDAVGNPEEGELEVQATFTLTEPVDPGSADPGPGPGPGPVDPGPVDPGPGGSFVGERPARLFDTRRGEPTVDGRFTGGGRMGPGSVAVVQVAGRGGVSPDARRVVLNVTAVNPSAAGFVTVYPCVTPRPWASTVNPVPGEARAAAALVGLNDAGRVCVFTSVAMDLIVDVVGVFDDGFVPVVPARLADTRGDGESVDGRYVATGRRGSGQTWELPVAGRGDVPAGAGAVALNVTAVNPVAEGFVTVFPCGRPWPGTSNVNVVPGDVRANAVVSGLDGAGRVCVFTQVATDLVIDVTGWFEPRGLSPVGPSRVVDTRPGFPTVDRISAGSGSLTPRVVTRYRVAGRGDVPAGAGAVALNVTAVNPVAEGFVTVFPCGRPWPGTSNVNVVPGDVRANAVVVELDGAGDVCVYANVSTDLVIDVTATLDG